MCDRKKKLRKLNCIYLNYIYYNIIYILLYILCIRSYKTCRTQYIHAPIN
jgi:hypothetical protein